jgi:hypothetical protein
MCCILINEDAQDADDSDDAEIIVELDAISLIRGEKAQLFII